MSESVVWRIEALSAPRWVRPCPACRGAAPFESSARFRVNANGGRVDVWLLYRCRACGTTAKRSVLRRAAVAAIDPARLDAYHHDDPALARIHAFELPAREPLAHRVLRPPLPESRGSLDVRIEQPFACGLRFDGLLAAEIGWPRARVARAFAAGRIALAGGASLGTRVRDGDAFRIAMP